MDAAAPILVLGLNPAMQRMLEFEAPLAVGGVNRCVRAAPPGVGGKGQQFAKALSCHGRVRGVCVQFLGGKTGQDLERLLRARLDPAAVVTLATVRTEGETRVCTTLVAGGVATEVVEPSARVSASEMDAMADLVLGHVAGSSGIAVMGTAPPGVPVAFYARVADRKRADQLLLLDGCAAHALAMLDTGKVDVLKVNKDELERIGRPLEQLLALVPIVAVTDGGRAACLYRRGHAHAVTYTMPAIDVVNPIGAGDCCAAVLLAELVARGRDAVCDAFRVALASACASCLNKEGAVFDRAVRDGMVVLSDAEKQQEEQEEEEEEEKK